VAREKNGGGPGTDVASGHGMHAMIFEPKLAHLAAQSLARDFIPYLECDGITPARFDMLRAIGWESRRQDELARTLGVSSSNVARMVKALVKLDFVHRTRSHDDGRTWTLWLTEKATDLLRNNGADVMKWVHRTIIKLLFDKRKVWLESMMQLEEWFGLYTRKLCHRRLTLLYLYGHPDD
jgi:DNA-binding MarR family transcriptional regulator